MGRYLFSGHARKKNSLIETCFKKNVPIFCPAFSDCSAGFGLSAHQQAREADSKDYVRIDSVRDFRHLTYCVTKAQGGKGSTGLFMIGGGTPKNFLQDTVVNSEMLGYPVSMHKYAIQITVADVRDGGCSSSGLDEANSWGKVDKRNTAMVYDEATKSWPLIASAAYHETNWSEYRSEFDLMSYLKTFPSGRKR